MRQTIFFVLLFSLGQLSAQEIILSTLNNLLYSLDLSDCSYQQIGAMPVSSTDISFHPNGNLYSVSSTGSLFQIDPGTGTNTLLHTFEPGGASQLYTALTISAEGVFYVSGLGGDLWIYDLISDTGTFVGNTGFGAEGDLTFYEGELYMAAENDNIVLVDIDVPANSTIAINGSVPGRIFGVVSFAASCEEVSVYALTDNAANVYEVDFENSSLNFFCSIPLQVSGGASTFEFLGSNPVFIDEVDSSGFDCGTADGTLTVTASGGVGALSYSLDGIDYQSEPVFGNLAVETFTVYVADEVGCIRTATITVEADVPVFTDVRITNTTCGEPNGQIEVVVSGGTAPYEFYVNGQLSGTGLTVTDLADGNYQLMIVDAAGCSASSQANLGSASPPTIEELNIIPTSCGLDNGSISVQVNGGLAPMQFSLNGASPQATGDFPALPAGDYDILITDQSGCTDNAVFTIDGSIPLVIEEVVVTNASCEESNGVISVQASGGQPPLEYSLGGSTPSPSPVFEDLDEGNYEVMVMDDLGCISSQSNTLGTSPAVELELLSVSAANCLEDDGIVNLGFSGGLGDLQLFQNGSLIPALPSVEKLAAGFYSFMLTDSVGCTASLELDLPAANCPVYLPNIFSPNLDGVNDKFGPQSVGGTDNQILRFQIYDRWGGLVFEQFDGLMGEDRFYWDGHRAGEPLSQGIYVYFLEVAYPDSEIILFSGDVMLLK